MIDLLYVDSDTINKLTTFSSKTSTRDRKYMVMMCSVFYQLIKKEENKKKLKTLRECFKKLSKYITENKMLPNEELVDILNKKENSENTENSDNIEKNENILYEEPIEENDKNNTDYIFSNIKVRYKKNENELKDEKSRNQFEKDIFAYAENNGYDGKFEKFHICFDSEKMINNRWIDVFSPKKIYLESKSIINIFLKMLNSEILNKNNLLEIIANQLFYFKILPIEKWTDLGKNQLRETHLNNIVEMLSMFYVLLKQNIGN